MRIHYALIIFCCGTITSFTHAQERQHTKSQKMQTSQYNTKLIPALSGTYGYEIYVNDKLFIRQVNVPGIGGIKGFKQKRDALKVGKLVIDKLSKGIMPPTINQHEMDILRVQY